MTMSILVTALLAWATGAYALFIVFHSVPLAVLLGALWGMTIFNLDRFLVMAIPSGSAWKVAESVALRILLGGAISIVIAIPLVLRLFEAEIEAALPRYVSELVDERFPTSARRTEMLSELERLREVHLSEVESLEQELSRELAGDRPGYGPYARSLRARLKDHQALVDEFSKSIARLRLVAVATDEQREAGRRALEAAGDSLLMRMQVMQRVRSENRVANWAVLVLLLLVLFVVTSPMIVHLLEPRRLLLTGPPEDVAPPQDEETRKVTVPDVVAMYVRALDHSGLRDAKRSV